MTIESGHAGIIDIYQILDDGRIVELIMGHQSDRDHAIWARNLSAQEKSTYLRLKGLGYSDVTIYNHLNQQVKKNAGVGR